VDSGTASLESSSSVTDGLIRDYPHSYVFKPGDNLSRVYRAQVKCPRRLIATRRTIASTGPLHMIDPTSPTDLHSRSGPLHHP